MSIPATVKQTADQVISAYCEQKVPMRVRDKVRMIYRWAGATVTLIEQRPLWDDSSKWIDSPIAQVRFNSEHDDWALYWQDRNQRWHFYEKMPAARSVARLLAEMDQDPTGIFWG